MDMPRLEALGTYWMKQPPIHISMAAYVGWGKSSGSAQSGDVEALIASAPLKEMSPDGR